ncbi:hypothetical protein CcaverHIS002_0201810 [Cutaneotrichosporon cavernicola]|uniref:Enoyl reductase (ER) domain-containing protein n=1 Tax=Cutaneotrichosporon cavernicola TaxID=279322 RepID=A0AA48L1F4_9TREE|nr:uncharacterized protein CcaverHIS019_0201840 [Cutaneotrichosporon cavernicola]BEI81021.1 hypothetical protein CcaverHIS002_0201810 [Cutaneotrichosporon cavernicola]BEI88822.1 hypothetical protein CcaverHIS019_0201840 [Cutaneotrichosporon cavernicola]BEI96597.1 hypothetical protein CcaverHIS631_0201860 [Cutaneotrichosporon cavernicola]BEJ04369.1 hypothetical protein CcaverHIS641_0201860 [Cutaneotrichosporon cavernicola]
MAPTEQKIWIVNENPIAEVQPDTFRLETRPLPALKDGEVLVQVEFISNDPAQRGWIQKGSDPERAYVKPVRAGEPMRAGGVGKVVDSKSSKWKTGQRVYGYLGWADYVVLPEASIMMEAIDLPGVTAASLSVLGMVAVTAYQGIFEVLDCKPEHTVLVSGAAGAVGSAAIQYAKHVVGAKRVVGIAGGPEKCRWVESIGADACVDYKDPNFAANLKEALQGYADRYFENVGGQVLNAAFRVIKRYGKIGICGMISGYNGKIDPLPGFFEVISNRLTIEGFLVLDVAPRYGEIVQKIAGWAKEGKIKLDESETVVPTKIDDVPQTWQRLFRGENRGKLVTQLVV